MTATGSMVVEEEEAGTEALRLPSEQVRVQHLFGESAVAGKAEDTPEDDSECPQ